MKNFRLLGLAFIAVLALGATVIATSASGLALPLLLGENNTPPESFSGENDGSVLELEDASKNKVNCTAATGPGGETSDTLGTFHITFTGCENKTTGKCKSSGDSEGSILVLGTEHYVLDTLGLPEESVAVLFLPQETSFECTVFAKNKVKGTLLCLWLKPLVFSKHHFIHCNKGKNAGEQEDRHYYNDNGELVTAHLESSLNGGSFVESNELALFLRLWRNPVAFMTTD